MINIEIVAKDFWGHILGKEKHRIRTWYEKDSLWLMLKKKYPKAYRVFLYSDGQIVERRCFYVPSQWELRRQMETGRFQAKDLWKIAAKRF